MYNPKPQSNKDSTDHNNWYHETTVQFKPCNNSPLQSSSSMAETDDDSGINSPPLWKNSPSPPKSPSQPLLGHHNYRSLSPNSRAQAIARGQWELMEMVKNMPESSYELSLKDLVEHHHRIQTQPEDETSVNERGGAVKETNKSSFNKSKSGNVMRNGSFENRGLVLNFVFPFTWKSAKKKKKSSGNSSGRVSPGGGGCGGGGEKDWWKKRFTGSSDSDGSGISGTSGSSGSTASSGGSSSGGSYGGGAGRRKRNGVLSGCWPCFIKSRTTK